MSFVRLHERGFGVPVYRFMRALCDYYGGELHNFSPNSISQAAVFVAVCEGYLGIEVHWDLRACLVRKGLTAAAVIANFHRQRVIPLVERALPIYELTPGSKVEGSRTSSKLLSHTNAARRAKYAVAEFPQDPADLWRIKMRPEPGYISLVSFGFELVVRRVVPFFLTPSSGVFYRG